MPNHVAHAVIEGEKTMKKYMKFSSIFAIGVLISLMAWAGVDTSNNFRLGDGQASNKAFEFNRGLGASNPKLRWNQAQLKLQFSNDGTNFTDIGSGGGGGGSVSRLQLVEGFNFGEKLRVNAYDNPENTLRASFATPLPDIQLFLLEDATASSTSITALVNPKFVSNANKNFDGATGWTALTASGTITTSLTKKIGTNSLSWNKTNAATASAIYLDVSATPFGLGNSREVYYFINLPNTTNLVNVGMRFSPDAIPNTNYREFVATTTASGGALNSGWNLIKLSLANGQGTITGTGWLESDTVNSIAFVVNTSSAGQLYSGLLVDSLAFSPDDFDLYLQKGDALSIADGANTEEITVNTSSVDVKGPITLVSGLVNNYSGGQTTVVKRSIVDTSSPGVARFDTSLTGAAQKTQAIRLKRNLGDTVSGTFFDVSVTQSTPYAFYVSDVDSTTQIKVTDPQNNSAELLSGDKFYILKAIKSSGKTDYIYRNLKLTLSGNSSASAGKTTLQSTTTNAGVVVGDLIVKEDVEVRASMVALGAAESFSSPIQEQKLLIDSLGYPYPQRNALFAHYTLSGPDGFRNKAGPAPDLTVNGSVPDGIAFLQGLFSKGVFVTVSDFLDLSVSQSAPMKSDTLGLNVAACSWLYLNSLGAGGNFSMFGHTNGAGGQGWEVVFNSPSDQIAFYGNGASPQQHSTLITAGVWHQVCVNLGGAGSTMQIVVDGVAENFTQPSTDNSTSRFIIGVSGSEPLTLGYLSQVVLWTGVNLTSGEFQSMYNNGRAVLLGEAPAIKHVYQTDPLTGQLLSTRVDLKKHTSAAGPVVTQVSVAKQ